jgi:hypothetical protein
MPPKTFDHLVGRRRPNVYEEISSYVQWGETFRGKFPGLPSDGAYYHFPERYKLGYWDPSKTAWVSDDWESFRDPAQLTYRSYHEIQSQREAALTSVFDAARQNMALRHIDEAWLQCLRTFFSPLRFAEWGMSMASQYVARFAISGLITNAALLQCFDELRHTQRVAEWGRELETAYGGFADYRTQWLEAPMFQPLREYIERLCVTKDWGEVIVAGNIVLEPLLQPVLHSAMADLGHAHGDAVLPHFAYQIQLDEERHWGWGRALAAMLHQSSEQNVEQTQEWVDRWWGRADRAVSAFGAIFESVDQSSVFDQVLAQAQAVTRESFAALNITEPTAAAVGAAK